MARLSRDLPTGYLYLRHAAASDFRLIGAVEEATGALAGQPWTVDQHRTVAHRDDGVHLVVTVDDEAIGFVLLAGKSDPSGDVELRRLLMKETAQNVYQMAVLAVMDLCSSEWCANRLWVDRRNCDANLRLALRRSGFVPDGASDAAGDAGDTLPLLSMLASMYVRRWDPYRALRRIFEQ
jgi:diamine N-acetyltransferase